MNVKKVVILAASLLVVGGGAFYFIKKRKSGQEDEIEEETEGVEAESSSASVAEKTVKVTGGLKSGKGFWVKMSEAEAKKLKKGDNITITGGAYNNSPGTVTNVTKNKTIGWMAYLDVPYKSKYLGSMTIKVK